MASASKADVTMTAVSFGMATSMSPVTTAETVLVPVVPVLVLLVLVVQAEAEAAEAAAGVKALVQVRAVLTVSAKAMPAVRAMPAAAATRTRRHLPEQAQPGQPTVAAKAAAAVVVVDQAAAGDSLSSQWGAFGPPMSMSRPRLKMTRAKNRLWKKRAHRCHYCDGPLIQEEATVDHYLPLALGGRHHDSNMVLACRPCNLDKADLTPSFELLERLKTRRRT